MNHEPGTPLPWRYEAIYQPSIWPNGSGAAVASEISAPDAIYAVHAANAYPKLVAALKAIASDPDVMSVRECMGVAEVALKEVGEL